MKKTLKDYLIGVKKTHKYTVRIAKLCELTDSEMTLIENNLKAYELVDITTPKKTIFQAHPLGFTEPTFSNVIIFDIELGLPASSFYLSKLIAKVLKISDDYVVVNGVDNPVVSPEDVKATDYYGDEYNSNMLKTILDARAKDPNSIVKTYSDKDSKK